MVLIVPPKRDRVKTLLLLLVVGNRRRGLLVVATVLDPKRTEKEISVIIPVQPEVLLKAKKKFRPPHQLPSMSEDSGGPHRGRISGNLHSKLYPATRASHIDILYALVK